MRKKTLKKSVQRLLFGISILSLGITFTGCHASHSQTDSQKTISRQTEPQAGPTETETSSTLSLIDASGMTLESRIHTPDGYTRTKEADGSLAEFLRNYAMEPDQSPVLLYDGSKKRNQKAHVAVFDLPLEHEDLQQCADSVIRVYAEYFWSTKQYDRIAFHFTNGFDAQYTKWADGYRIRVNGNNVSWIKSAQPDTSYDSLKDYLRIVFSYAGTASMDTEAQPIPLSDLQVGDVFLKGGNPGHVVMVVDLCENADGKKAFLLAQGYMPAQQFHVLKNPAHEDDPWYYEDEVTYPFHTPEYTFQKGSLKRLNYGITHTAPE